jgi:hypothetical protein
MSRPSRPHRKRPYELSPEEQIAAFLRDHPPPTKLQQTLMYREDTAARLANLRTLCDEVEEVIAQSVRYGSGVGTRRLLERLRIAEGELACAVAVAAEDAGLVAAEG